MKELNEIFEDWDDDETIYTEWKIITFGGTDSTFYILTDTERIDIFPLNIYTLRSDGGYKHSTPVEFFPTPLNEIDEEWVINPNIYINNKYKIKDLSDDIREKLGLPHICKFVDHGDYEGCQCGKKHWFIDSL